MNPFEAIVKIVRLVLMFCGAAILGIFIIDGHGKGNTYTIDLDPNRFRLDEKSSSDHIEQGSNKT